ncbi:hypothetical protein PPACK8108_LOCUS22182 [Phakopsora pachyrhizi]|uniref:Coil containing protein n=1 Tax=Phakopsora pachyrhizi TaxID=170000 RepID=A0AAV0BLD1_PHAPC|nr:hypothetical protein PPACK8108_LOCUS22182 [Phakopsora pachyrhizi]
MFNPTSTANNQSPMARIGLTADEYMIEDALKAQAEFAAHRFLELSEDDEFTKVWIEEQEEAEEQKLIEKNLKFWDEFKLNGCGVKIDEVFDVLKDQLRINNE